MRSLGVIRVAARTKMTHFLESDKHQYPLYSHTSSGRESLVADGICLKNRLKLGPSVFIM